jgi:hypothetical protein
VVRKLIFLITYSPSRLYVSHIMSTSVSTFYPGYKSPLTLYGKAFLKMMGGAILVAGIAGLFGLAPQLNKLMAGHVFRAFFTTATALYALVSTFGELSRRGGGPTGICRDVQMVIFISILPPIFGGLSALNWVFLGVMNSVAHLI